MAKFFVYKSNGEKRTNRNGSQVFTEKLTYNSKFMGEESVTMSFSSPAVVDFVIGDYVMYRGHKYVLSMSPSAKKNARPNTNDNSFVYDSVKFVSLASDEMTRCEFRDIVLNGEKEHYNFAAMTFSFYCNSLIDFGDRVLANLRRMYGNEAWRVLVRCNDGKDDYYYECGSGARRNHDHAYGEKNISIAMTEGMVWDSLSHVKEDFDENFVVVDRVLMLGSRGDILSHHFHYGKSDNRSSVDKTKGVFSIERVTDNGQAVITRARAYGSEKNMPERYYVNLYSVCVVPKKFINSTYDDFEDHYNVPNNAPSFRILLNSDFWGAFLESHNRLDYESSQYGLYIVKLRVRDVVVNAQYEWWHFGDVLPRRAEFTIYGYDYGEYANTIEEMMAFYSEYKQYVENGNYPLVVYDGADKDNWDWKEKSIDCIIPSNMNVKCLMMPGFGFIGNSLAQEVEKLYARKEDGSASAMDEAVIARLGYNTYEEICRDFTFSADPSDPYVEAKPQIEAYGVREGTFEFNKGGDKENIYPSLKYSMKLEDDNELNKIISADQIEDDGVLDEDELKDSENTQFKVRIPNIGFDIRDHLGSDDAKLAMKDGPCGGREFRILKGDFEAIKEGGKIVAYEFKCERVEDTSLDLYFPYKDFNIRPGDEFAIVDIEFPDEYVKNTALYGLLPAAIEKLKENCDVRYKYNLNIDSIQMARQHDEAVKNNELQYSVYYNIKGGDLVLFGDEDLGINYEEGSEHPITGSVLIDSVEIKEGDYVVPNINVQLVDEISVSTITKMQKQIDSIVSGKTQIGGTAGGGYNASDIQRLIRTYGGTWFLSKQNADRADGVITFAAGLVSEAGADIKENLTVGGEASSTTFVPGIEGWKIKPDGTAELGGLTLRNFLAVPELRYNRVEVQAGFKWHTFGGGVIESVEEIAANKQYRITLRLEEGEGSTVRKGDYCMGIWHNLEGDNYTATEDGKNGNVKISGFQTVYFKVTQANSPYKTLVVELREDFETPGGELAKPSAGMHFACYANDEDETRQSCWYEALDYTILLTGMNDWTYGSKNIQMIYGNLNGFVVNGQRLSGYGLAVGNTYMWGSITQFDRDESLSSITAVYKLGDLFEVPKVDDKWSAVKPSATEASPVVWQAWKYTYTNKIVKYSEPWVESRWEVADGNSILRPLGMWSAIPVGTKIYCNAYTEDGSGIKYLDYVVDDRVNSGTQGVAFIVKTTHTKTEGEDLSDGTLWRKASTFKVISTDVLLAQNAFIKLGQGNVFYVTDEDGNIVGGLSGYGEGFGDVRLWIGSDTPEEAPFKVSHDGRMISTNINAEFIDLGRLSFTNGAQMRSAAVPNPESGSEVIVPGANETTEEIGGGAIENTPASGYSPSYGPDAFFIAIKDEDGVFCGGLDNDAFWMKDEETGDMVVARTKNKHNLLANGKTVVLPTYKEYIGTRVLIYNSTGMKDGRETKVFIDGESESEWMFLAARTTYTPEGQHVAVQWDEDVAGISFTGGVMEFVGCPRTLKDRYGEEYTICTWTVVSTGMSRYTFNPY